MGKQLKSPIIYLLVPFIAAIIGWPARSEARSVSYNPQLQDFPDEQLYRAYLVIQHFKSTITSDPKNVTATWTGHDLCGEASYTGFYCDALPGRPNKMTVTAVILNGFMLHAPTLQGFVDQLPDLALFHAASNNFGGDIPRLTGLGYKYALGVSNARRKREAPVPPANDRYGQIGGSGNLNSHANVGCVTADIDFNFTFGVGSGSKGGIIPGVTDAKALILNYNNLSGKLPANIGLSKLSYLALANNKLTGPIPPSIGHLQDSLLEVLLLNNQLSGCLPHELGMLTKTSVIDAGTNQLTGPIPSSFSCLTSVEQLNLAGNRLYGQVPDALCSLAGPAGRLANLTLSGNYFTSIGPACSALVKDGVLDVKSNCIPGFANQRSPAECASFLSKPKNCPAASAPVACPAATDAGKNAPATEGRVARDYSSYVTYATLHE